MEIAKRSFSEDYMMVVLVVIVEFVLETRWHCHWVGEGNNKTESNLNDLIAGGKYFCIKLQSTMKFSALLDAQV